MVKHGRHILLLSLLVPLLTQCAAPQDIVTLDRRVRELDANLQAVDQNVGELTNRSASIQGKASALEVVQQRQAEMANQLDQMKAELLRVTGQMDEASYNKRELVTGIQDVAGQQNARLDQLATQVEAFTARLAQVEAALDIARQAKVENTAEEARTAAQEAEQARAEAQAASGPMKIEPNVTKKRSDDEPAEKGEKGKTAPPPDQKSTRGQALYDGALALLQANRNKEAYSSFKQFINEHPDHALVPNALFWLGDSQFNENEYELSILEYQKVIEKYPSHQKAAAALFKQGLAFEKLNDKDTARIIYNKLIADFPKSDQVPLAQKRLQEMK